jgi:hypothetical protein
LKGICWEQRKNEKNPLPPSHTPPKLKRKKIKALLAWLAIHLLDKIEKKTY